MNSLPYNLEASPHFLDFEFSSTGPKGEVRKIVRFTKMKIADASIEVYNIGFGDYNKLEDKIDDLIVTDNKDSDKVMASVAAAVMTFTDHRPETLVFAQGSTAVRTRYYNMVIAYHYKDIKSSFDVWGHYQGEWEVFKQNKAYTAILAKRK
ncbi:DUF6934 family protein [Ohtaekwangia koreensis]|uniref:Uncharacterized protein n=1 Tax=Ohtaekwangia koreensis TaxID=688867 RepID=A0A1T5KR75_9BACT|nr:hypothetical protein [Ohtaekwangia koreensis]SKC66197.1 hypothetical protein SAMN05660236_2507 [Ohtaekwangia koreensis]